MGGWDASGRKTGGTRPGLIGGEIPRLALSFLAVSVCNSYHMYFIWIRDEKNRKKNISFLLTESHIRGTLISVEIEG